MANVSNFTALSKRIGPNKNLIANPLTETEKGIINRANTPAKPVTPTPAPSPVWNISDASGTRPMGTPAAAGTTTTPTPALNIPQAPAVNTPTSITDVVNQTYAQKAQSQLEGEFKTNFEAAQKQGITLPYKTLEEYKAYVQKPAQDALNFGTQQQELARKMESSVTGKALQDIEAAKASGVANFAQGREGVQSAGNVMAGKQFATEMDRRSEQINLERQSNDLQRQQATEGLKRAKESGDVQLANAIQGQLSSLEDKARQLDIDSTTAATQASAEARAVQAQKMSNLTTFKGFLTEGIELPASAIDSFAATAGLDSGMLAQAYLGAQSIRQDKNLSREEKAVKLNDLQIDLDRKQKGLDDIAARRADYLSQLYKSGASKEDISAYKDAAGIKDKDDPAYILDQKIKALDYQLKAQDLTGDYAPGSPKWIEKNKNALDLATKQREYADLYGSEYDPTIFGVGDVGDWCGVYASKVSTAAKVGDTWAEKKTKIEDQMPSVGDKLLLPLGVKGNEQNPGHVAVVIGYDPVTGDIKVSESNKDNRQGRGEGAGVVTFGNYNVNSLNAKFGGEWGVAHGELRDEYKAGIGKGASSDANKIASTVRLLATASDKKDVDATVKQLYKAGDTKGLQNYVTRVAFEDLSATDQSKMLLRSNLVARGNQLVSKMAQYTKNGGDLGIFSGALTKARKSLNSEPTEAQAIGQSIILMLEDFGRAQTGAAIQDFENKRFADILPNIFDSGAVAANKIKSFSEAVEGDTKNALKFKLGEDVYNKVFRTQPKTSAETFGYDDDGNPTGENQSVGTPDLDLEIL